LVLAPALAVDFSGTRLGRGGGWYDRALAHASADALVLAVCFPWEVLPAGALPRQFHDRPVDGALTNQGVSLF
jgi:5-formyltetrahydrofolate cyclo-ligase